MKRSRAAGRSPVICDTDTTEGRCKGPCCAMLAIPAAEGSAGANARALRKVIDVHHHYFPKEFIESHEREGGAPGFAKTWTPARMDEEMEKNGIEKAVLSLASAPIGWFRLPHPDLRAIVRACNDFGARLVDERPDRLALFGYIAGPDVDGCLREIEYAFDVLKADGIEMSTSFGDMWPGDPRFAPVLEELDRRKAIVYFHPLAPFCCSGIVPGVGDSWIEYPYDTGRAILSLMFNGAFVKHRNIRWLFSHSGGAIPYLAHRIEWQSKGVKNIRDVAPDGVVAELRKLYFETANAASAPTMAALTTFAPIDHIMYGSDFPYVTSEYNLSCLRSAGLSDANLAAIERGNAMKFIPRFSAGGRPARDL